MIEASDFMIQDSRFMDEEMKKLLERQTEFLKKMSEDIHAMKRATVVGRWVSITMFLLFFVIPLVVGVFLLPPLLQTFTSAYGGSGIDIGSIIKNPQKLQELQQQVKQNQLP